jgi:hypothetical protein
VAITSKEAAAAAKKYGLSLSDAAALARLADDVDDADQIAGMFVTPTKPPQLARDDLAKLSPSEIEDARVAGRLDDILGVSR